MLGSREFRVILTVIGIYPYGISAASVPGEEPAVAGSSTDATSEHSPPLVLEPTGLSIPFHTCYVQESMVTHLMVQMSSVLRMLNNDQDYVDSKLFKLKEMPKLQEYEMCSEERIQKLTEELRWVSRRLWELSIRLEEPKDAEVQMLDKRKVDLIHHLHNVVVFTGGSSIPASAMKLESFDVKVEYLEYGFNTALVMFQTERQLRPTLSPGWFAKKTLQSILLEPSKSTAELVEISRKRPDAMSEALPQLVAKWYDGNLKNSRMVLDFIERLPKVVHQMIGYAALYDAMDANSDLESYELTKLVFQLKGINASVSAAADIPHSVSTRYTQLVNDVWPVYQIVGIIAKCNFRSVKYERSINGNGLQNVVQLFSAANSRYYWDFVPVPGTAMFTTPNNQWYSSATEVFSTSKRIVKYRKSDTYVSQLYGHWKLVPMNGGKYFKVLNGMYNEVLFADKTEMDSDCASCNRVFLARHDYPHAHDYAQNADLWIIDCK